MITLTEKSAHPATTKSPDLEEAMAVTSAVNLKKSFWCYLSENHHHLFALPGPHDTLALPLPVVGAQHVGPRHPCEDPGLGHGHGEHLVSDQGVLTVIVINTWQ